MTDDESSVRVALRIRPQLPREVIDMCRVCTSVTPSEPQVTLGVDRSFTFDYVFDTGTDQATIYDSCTKALVDGSLQGYNATVLAYGQTGSGKTYTMGTGFDIDVNSEQIGIIPRAIHQLFDGITLATESGNQVQFKVTCQFLELYNEEIVDLFDTSKDYSSNRGKSGIRIHEDANHCIYLTGVTSQRVISAEEALQWLRQGALSRTTASTRMNTQSSRSHAIFTLLIKQQRLVQTEELNEDEPEVGEEFETLTAKFHFVDLAGSERLKRTGATGERAKEGISINCGLLALGNVISALGDPSKRALHVPYRDSKLTRLLQDSLGGNSRTLMIACVSPSDRDFMETLNTLIYANRARNIQNKVVINQDKSSRTISLLKKQIQELELELMEYKQGKRMINEDGIESVNDMFHENTLLQTELDNLRTRVKAMQDTIDTLKAKNVELLADQQISASNADGDNKNDDMSQMIKGYLNEIETLRAKLVESESICSQLRKAATRNKTMFLNTRISHDSASDQAIDDILELAKKDVMKDLESLDGKKKDLSDQSESDSDINSSDSDNDDEDEDNKTSEYSAELANLTSEISVKQRLIEELEKTQARLNNMKQHYEDKLNQLQAKIIATQQERDTVLSSYSNENKPTEKMKKVKDEYERKLSDMQREVKSLQSAKKEHAKLLRNQNQYESQVLTLKNEIAEMKRIKVKLMNNRKEEALKHKDAETRRIREIAQLKKQTRLDANLIKNLEAEKRAKAIVLKRKQEEVSALRRVANSNSRMRYGLKGKGGHNKGVSPKQAKQRWIYLEKNISESTMNRQSLMVLEKEMEKKMESRVELQEELQSKLALQSDPRFRNSSIIKDEVESLRASLDHVQVSIADLQNEILQVEENKVAFESGDLVRSFTDIAEAAYILDKLYNMALHHSCLAVQKDVSLKELQAENEQLKRDSEMKEQLLQHLLESKGNKDRGNRSTGHSSPDSSKSSRSVSPTDNGGSTTSLYRHNSKYRTWKPLAPQDLLFLPDSNSGSSNNVGNEHGQSHSAATSPEHRPQAQLIPPPLTRSLTTIKVQSVPASPVMMRKGLSISPRVNRKTYIISSNHPSMEKGLDGGGSPPNSPPAYRRQTSREENVFSRLTSQPTPNTSNRNPGKITATLLKRGLRTPIYHTHIVEGHSRAVLSLHATDENLFTASRDRTVLMWDLNEMREVQMFGGHPNNVVACKYDPNNRLLFTVSSSYVKVWDVRASKCVKTLSSSGMSSSWSGQLGNCDAQMNDIALNDRGLVFYTASGDRVRIWDLRKFSVIGKLIGGHQAAVMCLVVSSSSTGEDVVVTGSKDHYIKVFDVGVETGGVLNPRMTLEPPHYDGIQCLAMKDNNLFSGSRDCIIKKWDLDNHELVTSLNSAHKDWVTGLCFAPGGSILLSGCRDGTIKLWSAETCSQIAEVKAHASPINAVASNSTHIFTAANNGEVRMWKECSSAEQQQQLPPPQDLMTMSTGHVFQLSV